VLTYGPFQHYRLNNTPYFYGAALNRAHDTEKSLPITGLLMDDHCYSYNHIFSSHPFADDWHYVFVTQAIDEWEDRYAGMIPLPHILVYETDLGWYLGPEVETLSLSADLAQNHPDGRVREKHLATLHQYRNRYPRCFAALENAGFKMEAISRDFAWDAVRDRMRESFSWASIRRPPRGALRRQPKTKPKNL
jgi:hypothetical protein